MRIVNLIASAIDDLRLSPVVEITRLDMRLPDDEEPSIDYLKSLFERSFGVDLPEGLEDALVLPPVCAVAWQYKSNGGFTEGGEFRLVALYDAFDSRRLKIEQEALPAGIQGPIPDAVYFDSQPEIGSYALLLPNKAREFPSVCFCDEGRIFPMVVGVRRYIELMSMTKGFYYWQYLFCDLDWHAYELGYRRSCVRKMPRVLARLFPENDLTVLERRLKQLDG